MPPDLHAAKAEAIAGPTSEVFFAVPLYLRKLQTFDALFAALGVDGPTVPDNYANTEQYCQA